MNKYFYPSLLALVLINRCVFCAAEPVISVEKERWHLGKVSPGQNVSKSFSIKNDGTEDLTIKKVHACCGYSIKDISVWDIGPGERSVITVGVDVLRKKPGEDHKTIVIFSNDPVKPEIQVPVSCVVPEKKIFTMCGVNFVPERKGILHRGNGWMLMDLNRDLQLLQYLYHLFSLIHLVRMRLVS